MPGRDHRLTAGSPLVAVLRRERIVVVAATACIALLGWLYTLSFASHEPMPATSAMHDMPDMDMGMDMADMPDMAGREPAAAPATVPWTLAAMWIAMMVGMMMPSVAPMLLVYLRVAQHAQAVGRPLAAVGWFGGGYVTAWIAFSIAAAVAQTALTGAAVLSPMMAVANPVIGGTLLIVIGAYQWTPVKDACLGRCRNPLAFVQAHGGFQASRRGSWALGLRHGLYCIGCCWMLMLLLFVAGVMNLVWIAALMVLVLIEKTAPRGRLIARASGVALVAAGIWMLVRR